MAAWTIRKVEEAQNVFAGSYPGEMRYLSGPLATEQVAITYRRMPRHTGGKGSHGHFHRTQEELYYVISGKLQFKLDDEIVEVEGPACVRVPPEVARSLWNEERRDAELLIVSTRIEGEDAVLVEDFWPR